MITKLYNTIVRAYERHDLSKWNNKSIMPGRKIYGFYHIYCEQGWEVMVEEQLARLKDSGLMKESSCLYISCIIRNDSDVRIIKKLAGTECRVEFISISKDSNCFEYPALESLRQRCLEEDCLVYYFHTKGITYQTLKSKDRKFNSFKHNIESWRKMMEYFILDKWYIAVNALNDGYDTYGCYRLPPPPRDYYLYAGNFWWSKSSYICKLPTLDVTKYAHNRFFAEEWLYQAHPRDFSAFDTMADLYYVDISPELYSDKGPSLLVALKFVLIYNVRKFRKQILHYDYKKHYQERYQRLRKGKLID